MCAFQKMRRLESLGYGEYIHHQGLKLNEFGVQIIEQDIKKHHILEKFLEATLKIEFSDACAHSNHISPFICDNLLNDIEKKMDSKMECNCGNCLDTPKNSAELEHCHWLKNSF